MQKFRLYSIFAAVAVLSLTFLSGCGDPVNPIDETGYAGTYYGKHFLADSAFIRGILGDPTATMDYEDTLIVTNGVNTEDGKLFAKSTLLGGGTIEINISNGVVTPVFLGDVAILGTILKNTKLTSGKGTWNADKTILGTQLVASVTYDFNGADIELEPVRINGQFTKQ